MGVSSLSKTLCIVPARGGSKGLPRKNVRLLGGAPLITHTIRAAKQSRIGSALVSTDDDEIAAIARDAGAEVPFMRPADLSNDQASSLSVLQHALQFAEADGHQIETVVFMQPTSPFRQAQHINEALDLFQQCGKNSVISVTSVEEFHPYFMFDRKDDGELNTLFDLKERPLRRQDLPSYYRINGAIYISRRSYYENLPPDAAIFDWNSCGGYVMDASSSIDINDYIDFQRAELMFTEQPK
ncbi:MAG: acylneuraminate cytidylyltransferase family protein [Candidatus Hinthialibacter antarcticus]|nr:acylneuraminate cytidylyltransferase family protein [Candidatus Hinthialibacter antarcticus]